MTKMLCKRTLRNTLFRITGTALGDWVALLQTGDQLICGDLADRHDVELGAEAVVSVRIGQNKTGSPLTGDGIKRYIGKRIAVDVNGDRLVFGQRTHRAGLDAAAADGAGLFLNGIRQNCISRKNSIGDDTDESLVHAVLLCVKGAGQRNFAKTCGSGFKRTVKRGGIVSARRADGRTHTDQIGGDCRAFSCTARCFDQLIRNHVQLVLCLRLCENERTDSLGRFSACAACAFTGIAHTDDDDALCTGQVFVGVVQAADVV